ncbi:MAG: carboxypeptidase-like regulatory domain-containing protein [Treponema sp.]|jgi:hypothetical protein|nr:carboxypeptidase-like regulatory domain-containing protein [Treponema sp.]
MEKILEKARMILRNVYVALGATAMPFLIHAAYGMRQPDPSSYTVPVQGRVVSKETGEPIVGISVRYDNYAIVNTDSDGRFLIYVPEEENSYSIRFSDIDGFEKNGFHVTEYMRITRDEIEEPLDVSLYRESQVAVIRGRVRSKGIIGKPVSGIRVSVYSYGTGDESRDTDFYSGFEVLSDKKGKFYIQVPERDTYSIDFFDANGLFRRENLRVTSNEIKRPLKVTLDKETGE